MPGVGAAAHGRGRADHAATTPSARATVQKLVVEAGGHVGLPALVRNQSGIVDNYELQVRGMPDGVVDVTPPSVYLVPFGAPSGTYEQEVEIHLHPPRSAEAEARLWDVEVVAVSRARTRSPARRPAKIEITPYEQLESELRPLVVTGRRRGEFALMVRNRANAPLDTEITAVDSANALTFEFAKQRFVAEPGRRDGTTFKARAKRTLWIGRPTDRRFDIVAKGLTSETATTRPITGTFRQKPLIPFWVPIVVPALIAGAILAYSLIPKKTTVPSLRGRTAAAALVLLQKSHLKAATNPPREVPNKHIARGRVVSQTPKAGSHVKNNTVVTFTIAEPLVPNLLGKNQSQAKLILGGRGLVLSTSPPETKISRKPPGTIIGQVPGSGRPARTGAQVSIIVAIGAGVKKVPNVVGLTLAAADATLRSGGLTIVLPTVPPGQDPTKVTIASQIPTAGETVKSGQPVQVFLVPPPKPPPTKHTGPKKLAVVGASASAAAAAVAAAGGTPSDREAVRRREAGHRDQRADAGLAGPAGADRGLGRVPADRLQRRQEHPRHERRQWKHHGCDREVGRRSGRADVATGRDSRRLPARSEQRPEHREDLDDRSLEGRDQCAPDRPPAPTTAAPPSRPTGR